MSTQPTQRPKWEIDHVLQALVGQDVRVAAQAFALPPRNGANKLRFTDVRDLVLPDNSQPAGLPVYFEGRLIKFERQIGVVFVWLDATAAPKRGSDGTLCFRGRTAVAVRGEGVVQLAFPFRVERLPTDEDNYWRDLKVSRAQFEFPFAADATPCDGVRRRRTSATS